MILEIVDNMLSALVEAKKDAERFDAGNKLAGKRIRATMQKLKKDAQIVRFKIVGK